MFFPRRPGYIFLISVLFIGAIALATSISLLLLGATSQLNGETSRTTAQSLEWARSCIDTAILQLQRDLTYAGGEALDFPRRFGKCRIRRIGGTGNMNRTICVSGEMESVAGKTTRQVVVRVKRIFPRVVIDSYKESLVPSAADCR